MMAKIARMSIAAAVSLGRKMSDAGSVGCAGGPGGRDAAVAVKRGADFKCRPLRQVVVSTSVVATGAVFR